MNQAFGQNIITSVQSALAEDIGSGDVTAKLINPTSIATAQIITRESSILCGQAWVEATFKCVNPEIKVTWHAQDGDSVKPNQVLFSVTGRTADLLTAERTALNFLQLLSGTATQTHQYVKRIAHTQAQILDTRKTIVGMRQAQKYAVKCGGGNNHRLGLYDAFLIKENHIIACGSIIKAVRMAQQLNLNLPIEVEVENLTQLDEAIQSGVNQVLLDNFDLTMIEKAVLNTQKRVKLEVSGGINLDNITPIAETGIDYISVGLITKNVKAIDLSMRLISDH